MRMECQLIISVKEDSTNKEYAGHCLGGWDMDTNVEKEVCERYGVPYEDLIIEINRYDADLEYLYETDDGED